MHQKECNQFVKFVCRILIVKKGAALQWFASVFVRQEWNTVLWRFLPNTPQFGKTCHILQDGTLSGSAVHTEG